ncbi:sulfotransferase family protein [Rhodobium gokarnense]|uniref:Sulfotransferase family protein n=1 Tax=Rhodobium gokarnense TaxID=364296 RepID=A0ABT3HEC7_9HYPH|nr:sulfotransferase family protein [Rhodobium gokarnense]MCW2308626.1 hypothetical protein [Rhodobium gokarnense]
MSGSSAPREIVFVHIPKTAGTAVRGALVKALPDYEAVFDYGPKSSATSEAWREALAVADNPMALAGFRQAIAERGRVLLAGHFEAFKYWNLFAPESFIAVLRDPVERVLSEFSHHRGRYGYEDPIEVFIERPRLRNVMARYLRGTDPRRFGFIGISERLERDIPRLSDVLGVRLKVPRTNIGVHDETVAGHMKDAALRHRIRELNAEDQALYEFFLDRAPGEAVADPLPPALAGIGVAGRMRATLEGTLTGWAVDGVSERAVELEVRSGEAIIGRVRADGFSKWLLTRQLSRNGIGTFTFDLKAALGALPEAERLQTVTVRPVGGVTPIAGALRERRLSLLLGG